ncbi:biotin--[bacterium]|nr:biotin--[acetyl-CoA-carboxylase] ligase [bacterium]
MNKIGSILDFDSIDSTSKYLKENYIAFKDFTFVSSLYQTSGKGRMDRSWESNKGENLLFSLLIKKKTLLKLYSSISILSSTVILSVLKEYNIDNVMIKWPNDVYIDDKKVCGILLESISTSENLECIVLGIGLNVNQKEFMNDNATSMSIKLKKDINLKELKEKIYNRLMEELEKLEEGKSGYLSTIRLNNYLKNKEVYAIIDNEKVLSKVIDINDDNSIKVESNNKTYNLFSGEITFHV